jgi:hypothetical protein
MAFELRTRELRQRFDLLKGTLTPELHQTLGAQLDTISKAREEGLAALGVYLADTGDNSKASDYNDKLSSLSKSQLEQLQNLLNNLKELPPELKAFRDIASSEEKRFWDGLARTKAIEARDAMMVFCHNMEWFTRGNRAKWTTLSDTEKDLLQKERYYAAKLRETIKTAFEEAAPDSVKAARDVVNAAAFPETVKKKINEKYKDVLKSVVERVGGDPKKVDAFLKKIDETKSSIKDAAEQVGLDPDTASKVIDALTKPGGPLASLIFDALSYAYNPIGGIAKTASKVAVKLQPVAQSLVDDKVGEIRAVMGGRQTVIMTYSTTRKEAREFVEGNGYDKAKQLYQDNLAAMEDWCRSGKDALEGDARAFAKTADTGMSFFLEQTRKLYADFVNEFKGILVDSVSANTIDALADRPFYETWADGIDQLDMDQQLRKLYDGIYEISGDVDRAFGAMTTFNDLPLEAQSMIQTIINQFDRDVHQPFTQSMQEALKTLEAARNKQPATVAKTVKQAAVDLAKMAANG